jgi:hypothetical protein
MRSIVARFAFIAVAAVGIDKVGLAVGALGWFASSSKVAHTMWRRWLALDMAVVEDAHLRRALGR